RLPHDHGVVPHFTDSVTHEVRGDDYFSTIETAWLATGALWAAAYLQVPQLIDLAQAFYDRIDWTYWVDTDRTNRPSLLRHGKGRDRRFLNYSWDRLNGETCFMYVLAAGAAEPRAVPASAWADLQPFYGTAASQRFN